MEVGGTFDCNGKVNINDWQIGKSYSFLKNEMECVIFASQETPAFSGDVILFNNVVPRSTAILGLKHLTTCIEMNLKLLSRRRTLGLSSAQKTLVEEQPNYFLIRKNICECLIYIRSYLYSNKWNTELIKNFESLVGEEFEDLLLLLRKFLKGLKSLNDSVFHYAASNLGNKCLQPDSHIYHLHLELRWLIVTLLQAKEFPEIYSSYDYEIQDGLLDTSRTVNCSYQSARLDLALTGVIDDLIYIGVKLFERIPLADLRTKTPYSCTCAREVWLLLQIFIDNLAVKTKYKTFWQYVNDSLDKKIKETEPGNHSFDCKNPEIFCLWLIYHLALLYGYNLDGVYRGTASSRILPNYNQVEKILKAYINKGGKDGERDEIDDELGGMIPLLNILTCEWWQPRVEIVSLLWECFHRRLDQPFLLQSAGPWLASVEKKGPMDILKQVKQRLEENLEQNKLSSYGMFLRFLGIFLRKYVTETDSKYWNQMKGRIFSKFTQNKVANFSAAGLYNFLSLFLTLALTTNTSQVCTMMLNLLPSVLAENVENNRRIIIWKGELVIFLLFAEKKINFNEISERFVEEVDAISCRKDETSRIMLSVYIEVLDKILMASEKLDLSEHNFIGGWIDRYFLECAKNKVQALIIVLNNVFDKCTVLRSSSMNINSATTGSNKMLEALWKHVAGRVRMLVTDPQIYGDHYQALSQLAVKFTLEALKEPAMAARYNQKFVSLFKRFSSCPAIRDVRIIRLYLTLILSNENAVNELKKELHRNFDIIVIQAWIKCCILERQFENKEQNAVTRYVINCKETTQTFPSNLDLHSMENNEEAILIFIRLFKERYQSLQKEQERSVLGTKCREYFKGIETWAIVPIAEKTKEDEITHWIYRCIGTFIMYCSPMLYVKALPDRMLIPLINKFMLPTDKSSSYIMTIAKRIFSMIISGIGNLAIKGDLSLQLLIKNLFENYLALLITDTSKTGNCKVSNTLLECFRNHNVNYLKIILEQLAANFVVCRDGVTHKHCYLVMLLLRNLINIEYGPYIIDIIISVCLPHIITCYMKVHDLHVHKGQTIDLISDIRHCPYYNPKTKRSEEMALLLINTVPTDLFTISKTLYEFIASICKIMPELSPRILSKIDKRISELEKNKHPNVAALRFSLKQLEQGIQASERR